MPHTRLTTASAPQFLARAMKIENSSQRQWGKLEPDAVLSHLTRALEMSLGEYKGEDISNFFTRSWLFRKVFMETIPWPKGKIKAPDFFTPPPTGAIAEERDRLKAAVGRFIAAHSTNSARIEPSPLMGPLTLEYWSLIHGIHFEHHLKQFGV